MQTEEQKQGRPGTVNSVKTVISHICKLENGLPVRRKTKVSPVTNKTKWWFAVHANEGLLSELNTKWDQVKLQTSLKLEPFFMYLNSEGNNKVGAITPVSLSQDSAQQVHDNERIAVHKHLTCQNIVPATFYPATCCLKASF